MDAFKILARSTNLSQQARKFQSETRGTDLKRKRDKIAQSDVSDIEEPDFFQDRPVQEKRNQQMKRVSSAYATTNRSFNQDESEMVNLSVEKSKHLLKIHKLKITQIWPTPKSGKDRSQSNKHNEATGEENKSKKRRLDIVPQPLTSFAQLRTRYGVPRRICENLLAQSYTTPTEIQLGSLPLLLDSRSSSVSEGGVERQNVKYDSRGPAVDLLAIAPTGSGKTLAFLIPVLSALVQQRREDLAALSVDSQSKVDAKGPEAIVIAPTKELAGQIVNEARKLALNTGIRVSLIRKGARVFIPTSSTAEVPERENSDNDEDSDKMSVSSNEPPIQPTAVKAQLLVSTPLALLHALARDKQSSPQTNTSVKYLVLDEADVLLDPLFRDQTLSIWASCLKPSLRVTLWSATMGSSIEELALTTLTPRSSRVLRIVVGLKDSAIPQNITHKLTYCATEAGKLLALRHLLRPPDGTADTQSTQQLRPPFLVFTQSIPRASALHAELLYDLGSNKSASISGAGTESRIAVLHSTLSESARSSTISRFLEGSIWVLITTDLLSRGVDFRGVNGIVNYDFPTSAATYIHRVGRTGRAGRENCVAVTLYADEDVPFLRNITNILAACGVHTPEEKWAPVKVNRRDKEKLKKRGVESRRPDAKVTGSQRISTKSGYDRRLENKRKGAIEASLRAKKQLQQQQQRHQAGESHASEQANGRSGKDEDAEFEGFD